MSTTLTVTLEKTDYVKSVEELGNILTLYANCDDAKSKSIHFWGKGVLKAVIEHKDDPIEVIDTIARVKITVLGTEILVDPVTDRPLREPVLERDVTWEWSTHEEYRRLFKKSPFDGLDMLEKPPLHEYVAAMVKWMNSVTTTKDIAAAHAAAAPFDAGQLIPLGGSPKTDESRRVFYQQLPQLTVLKKQLRGMREGMSQAMVQSDLSLEEIMKRSFPIIAEAQQKADEHEAAVNKRLDSIEKTYQGTVDGLKTQIDSMKKQHHDELEVLERELEAVDQANIQAVETLTARIDELKASHRHAEAELQNQIDARHLEHVQTVARLGNQLAEATQVNEVSMNTLNETHRRDHEALGERINELEAKEARLKDSLKDECEANLTHQMEILRLKADLANKQQQINQLNQRLNNMDGGSDCSIM